MALGNTRPILTVISVLYQLKQILANKKVVAKESDDNRVLDYGHRGLTNGIRCKDQSRIKFCLWVTEVKPWTRVISVALAKPRLPTYRH
jgi:hypothetical protein